MSQLVKSSSAMGAATLASRVLGLVREMVYARFMGAGPEASAFKLAFQVPNLFRRLLGEGALTAAFIPIVKETEKTSGERAMWEAANAVISALLVVTALVVGAGFLVTSFILARASLSEETRLLFELLRTMLPYLMYVCLAAVFMGILNARGYFFIPALGAAVLNLVMIASVLFLAPQMGDTPATQIHALGIGILVAGLAQAGFQVPLLYRDGFRFRWRRPWPNATVERVVRRMIPATIGVAAFQINVLATYGFGFAVDKSIVGAFDYAVRLLEFPQGVVGISLATFLLPALSALAVEGKFTEFRSTLRQGLTYLIFMNLWATVLLIVLAFPMIRLLFEGGAFSRGDTHRASAALITLAPSLVAYSMVNVLARAFYALGDTKTPMKISVFCLGVNLLIALWLIQSFHEAGLGIANTLSSALNVWLLLYALRRRLKSLQFEDLGQSALRMLGAGILAGEVTLLAYRGWENFVPDSSVWARLGAVFVPMAAGSLIYLLVGLWLRIGPAQELGKLIRDRTARWRG